MGSTLYVDTSAILRTTLERGQTPEIEKRVGDADGLVTSRLSLVEAARALLRVRRREETSELPVAQIERDIETLFNRCELWELSEQVCDLAARVAPGQNLRTLDALHLATFLLARQQIENLELLTTDQRLRLAAGA